MIEKVEWKEKKTSLGNAIIIGTVMTVVGIFVGANFNNWFSSFAPYLGLSANYSSGVDWSSLDEVYNKLSSTYNGEMVTSKMIDGAKNGMVEALGDVYTV